MYFVHVILYPVNTPLIFVLMTKLTLGSLCLLFTSVVVMYGCSKSQSGTNNVAHVPEAIFTTDISQSPSYGDTVLYTQETGLVSPVNTLGAGTFVSWPEGLSIDPRTGVIDVSKSEPGSRYNVGFINEKTKDTSYSQIVVAGASYPDGIYYMDAEESLLQPYYNAGVSDLSGKGARFEGSNADPSTGAINLKEIVRDGLFGSDPQNGDTKQVAVYYRLNDGSKMSLQKTTLIFRYYNTISDVPLALASRFEAAAHSNAIEEMGTGPIAVTGGTVTAVVAKKATPAPVAPRPPQIVIVNKGH